jgi:hypothetical protein
MKELMQKLMNAQTQLNTIKKENQAHFWATGENLKEYDRLYDEIKNIKKEVRNVKKYQVVKIDQGNEYDFGLFYNEDEALAAAAGAWYHLTRYEQKSQAVEVRTDFTEYGYNTIQIYNFNVQELLDKIRGCERDIDDMLGDDEFILDVKQNREMIKSYEIRLKYLGHKLHDQSLMKTL